MHRKRARRIWGNLRKVRELSFAVRRRRVTFRLLAEARPEALCRVRTWFGTYGKVSIERLCLSPYVETFNSKVIKGFVPELRSRYVFFVFRDSSVLCIYVMNILCTFPISVLWVCYIRSFGNKVTQKELTLLKDSLVQWQMLTKFSL